MKKIPEELSFSFYSQLKNSEKQRDLLDFINDFCAEFGDSTISPRGDWRNRLDKIFEEDAWVSRRDGIICYNGCPLGIQQFSLSSDAKEAYAEGVFVAEHARGRGIAHLLREVLFSSLLEEGIRTFYIGVGSSISAAIRKNSSAQALAERDIKAQQQAILDLKRTEQRGLVSCYGFDLTKYNFKYNVRR